MWYVSLNLITLTDSPRRTGDVFFSGVIESFLSQNICDPVGAVYPLTATMSLVEYVSNIQSPKNFRQTPFPTVTDRQTTTNQPNLYVSILCPRQKDTRLREDPPLYPRFNLPGPPRKFHLGTVCTFLDFSKGSSLTPSSYRILEGLITDC